MALSFGASQPIWRAFRDIAENCGGMGFVEDTTTVVIIAYFNARAMMEVGSSVRTTIEESLKICSGSLMGSSVS